MAQANVEKNRPVLKSQIEKLIRNTSAIEQVSMHMFLYKAVLQMVQFIQFNE